MRNCLRPIFTDCKKKQKKPIPVPTMSTTAEVNEVDAEHVLLLVMENIVKYLDRNNLTNVANVCTSWRAEALREKEKRFYIQQLRLPSEIGNLDRILDMKPSLSLFIYECIDVSEQPDDVKLLEDSIVEVPSKTIGVGMHKYLTTEDAKFQISQDSSDRGVLGLFLSDYLVSRARVQVACKKTKVFGHKSNAAYEAVADELIERVGLNDREHHKPTLLVFVTMTLFNGSSIIASILCKRVHSDATNMIIIYSTRIVSAGFDNESQENNEFGLLLLKLSGPNIESCTTNINRYSSEDEIVCKLQELKKRLRPRRYFTGLFNGYDCCEVQCSHVNHPVGDCDKIMQILKDIFPGVPFVGMFGREDNVGFWEMCRHLGNFPASEFEARMFRDMWVMIISYD